MSSGTIPMYADVISQKKLMSLVPAEFDAFERALLADSVISEELIEEGYEDAEPAMLPAAALEIAVKTYLMWEGGPKNLDRKTQTAWRRLRSAFKKATGLVLYVGYYDEDSGGRYDEMDSVYWHVGGMYQLTEAGKKMKRFVTRQHFSQWG